MTKEKYLARQRPARIVGACVFWTEMVVAVGLAAGVVHQDYLRHHPVAIPKANYQRSVKAQAAPDLAPVVPTLNK